MERRCACGCRRGGRAARRRRRGRAWRGCRGRPTRGGRRACSAARSAWRRRAAVVASGSRCASERYAQARAFWTSGSASPISWSRSPSAVGTSSGPRPVRRLPWVIVAIVERDEPPLPARRGVHELLELRPAVGLGGDADPVGVGEVVDGDPVARLARRPSEELPGAFRVGGEGPLEQPEGEPARLEMGFAEQPVRDEQQLGGPLAAGLVPEPAARRRPGAAGGRRGRGRSRGRRTACPPGIPGPRGPPVRAEGRSRTHPGRRRGPRGEAPSSSAAGLRAATNATARWVVGLGAAVAVLIEASPAGASLGQGDVAIALREARACGPRRRPRTRRSPSRRRASVRGSTMLGGRVDDPAARVS